MEETAEQKAAREAEEAAAAEKDGKGAEEDEKPENPDQPGEAGLDGLDEMSEDDLQAEIEKRGGAVKAFKNLLAEAKKKGAKITELKAIADQMKALQDEIASLKNAQPAAAPKPEEEPDYIKAFRKSLKDQQLTDEFIEAQVVALKAMKADMHSEAEKSTTEIRAPKIVQDMLEKLSAKGKREKLLVTKYGPKLIEQYKKEKIQPQFWGQERLALNMLKEMYFDEMSDEPEPAPRRKPPTEGDRGGGSSGSSGGADAAEIEAYASQYDLDSSNKEVRESIKKILAIRKKQAQG